MATDTLILLYAGDDFVEPFQLLASGTPVNITGYSFVLTIKGNAAVDDALADLIVPGVITSASTGQVSFTLRAAATRGLVGTYFYKIKYTAPSGTQVTALTGALIGRAA